MHPKKQNNSVKMQMPSMAISKTNQEKAGHLVKNYLQATERQVKAKNKEFSTFATAMRFVKKDKLDPSEKLVLETVKRMEQDRLHSQIAMQISEMTMNNLQSFQKVAIFKMLPYLLGLTGLIIMTSILLFSISWSDIFTQGPQALFAEPAQQKYYLGLFVSLGIFLWGMRGRSSSKLEMLSSNILFQAASAYASAKLQGKGHVAALQNLGMMKRKAKSEQEKAKQKKKAKS